MSTFIIMLARIQSGGSQRRAFWLVRAVPFWATVPFRHTVFGSISKLLPRYPLIPATLPGRSAVNSAAAAKARETSLDGRLAPSLRNTAEVASVGVVVDALDADARSLYVHNELYSCLNTPNPCSQYIHVSGVSL
jgi:hypothetical protein